MSEFCDFVPIGNSATPSWRCRACGFRTHKGLRRAPSRVCKTPIPGSPAALHYLSCSFRAPDVLMTVNGRIAGYGCSKTRIEVYHCRYFNEPVLKSGHPPCLDTLREQVPGSTGRTCRECLIPMRCDRFADVIHVVQTKNWQNIASRGQDVLTKAGENIVTIEIIKPKLNVLKQTIEHTGARVVFIHALCLPVEFVISLAEDYPQSKFIITNHSHENHTFTWPALISGLRRLLEATRQHENLYYAGAVSIETWKELGYKRAIQWEWPVRIDPLMEPIQLDPPIVLLTSRTDIVKSIPSQLLAAAILQRRHNVRVTCSFRNEEGQRKKAFTDLAEVAGLKIERLPWLDNEGFLRRLRDETSLVLQPSMSETFNYISYEAGSVGRPWVGSTAIRHTPNDWRADPNNPLDIARVAEEILDNYDGCCLRARKIAEELAERNNAAYVAMIRGLLE